MEEGLELMEQRLCEQYYKLIYNNAEKRCKSIQEMSEEIVKNFGDNGKEDGGKLPIDIRSIIKKTEIELCEMNLNVDTGFQVEKVKGYVREQSNGKPMICIERNESESNKRYIMAREYGHFWLSKLKQEQNISCCVDPLFPRKQEEMWADMMASFLLFPYKSVLEHMSEYVSRMKGNNRYPIDGFEWLRILGEKAQVSSYYTIISYQYLKQFLCEYYNENPESDIIKEHTILFR